MKKLFILTLLFGVFSACQDDPIEPNDPNSPTNPNNPTPTSYFISFKVDGVSHSYVNGVNNYSSSTSVGGGIDAGNNIRYVNTSASQVAFDPITDDIMAYGSVGFNNYMFNLQDYTSDKAAALASILTVGAHPFSSTSSGDEGAYFDYFDGTDMWSAENGTQSGTASIVVTESAVFSLGTSTVYRKVKGTFNGTVYSDDGMLSKEITDGEFHLIFEAP